MLWNLINTKQWLSTNCINASQLQTYTLCAQVDKYLVSKPVFITRHIGNHVNITDTNFSQYILNNITRTHIITVYQLVANPLNLVITSHSGVIAWERLDGQALAVLSSDRLRVLCSGVLPSHRRLEWTSSIVHLEMVCSSVSANRWRRDRLHSIAMVLKSIYVMSLKA